MAIRYKGRTFSSGRTLADAIAKDIRNTVERRVRQAASSSGLSVRKTSKGLEIQGDPAEMSRFYDRFGR